MTRTSKRKRENRATTPVSVKTENPRTIRTERREEAFERCIADVLFCLGLFGSVEEAIQALDRSLSTERSAGASSRNERRTFVGRKGKRWSRRVLERTVAERGFETKELLLDPTNTNDKEKINFRPDSLYVVDGVLNRHWEKDNGVEMINDPTDDGPGPEEDENRWRHTIAVKNDTVLDQNGERVDSKYLWLGNDNNNEPDPEKGYMRKITRIFVLVPRRTTSTAGPSDDPEEESPAPVNRTGTVTPLAKDTPSTKSTKLIFLGEPGCGKKRILRTFFRNDVGGIADDGKDDDDDDDDDESLLFRCWKKDVNSTSATTTTTTTTNDDDRSSTNRVRLRAWDVRASMDALSTILDDDDDDDTTVASLFRKPSAVVVVCKVEDVENNGDDRFRRRLDSYLEKVNSVLRRVVAGRRYPTTILLVHVDSESSSSSSSSDPAFWMRLGASVQRSCETHGVQRFFFVNEPPPGSAATFGDKVRETFSSIVRALDFAERDERA